LADSGEPGLPGLPAASPKPTDASGRAP